MRSLTIFIFTLTTYLTLTQGSILPREPDTTAANTSDPNLDCFPSNQPDWKPAKRSKIQASIKALQANIKKTKRTSFNMSADPLGDFDVQIWCEKKGNVGIWIAPDRNKDIVIPVQDVIDKATLIMNECAKTKEEVSSNANTERLGQYFGTAHRGKWDL